MLALTRWRGGSSFTCLHRKPSTPGSANNSTARRFNASGASVPRKEIAHLRLLDAINSEVSNLTKQVNGSSVRLTAPVNFNAIVHSHLAPSARNVLTRVILVALIEAELRGGTNGAIVQWRGTFVNFALAKTLELIAGVKANENSGQDVFVIHKSYIVICGNYV